MFRAASRLPKRTLLATSVAGAVVLHEQPQQKLSIYPSPAPDVVLVETPTALETQISIARRQLCQAYQGGRDYVQGWVSKWIGIEHAVENRVKLIVSPQESLTPGLLYIGVATLTGSILARNRGVFTRLVLPPIFLTVSTKHFLPKTTTNLSDYLGSLEDTHFPKFAEKHEIAKCHTAMTWEKIKDTTKDTRGRVNRGAVAAVERVQDATGLKLRETLGWAEKEVKQAVEITTTEVKEVLEKAAEDVKVTGEVEETGEAGETKDKEAKDHGNGEQEKRLL